MRIARKLFLLALTAMAAMALAASTASAQTIQVVQEDQANAHCPAAPNSTSGGCVVHGTGEIALVGHIFGIEATASDCNVEFEARLDEDGEGYAYSAAYTGDATHNCTRTPCGLPWRIHGEELGAASAEQETLTVEFCARPSSGSDNRCLTDVPISDTGDHDYRLTFNDLGGTSHLGADCELTSGAVNLETGVSEPPSNDLPHREIEIIHANDPS
jgi:hypothetical protein